MRTQQRNITWKKQPALISMLANYSPAAAFLATLMFALAASCEEILSFEQLAGLYFTWDLYCFPKESETRMEEKI